MQRKLVITQIATCSTSLISLVAQREVLGLQGEITHYRDLVPADRFFFILPPEGEEDIWQSKSYFLAEEEDLARIVEKFKEKYGGYPFFEEENWKIAGNPFFSRN